MEPLTIALGLAKYVPDLFGWLSGSKAKDVAQKAVDIAKTLTGQAGAEDAVSAIKGDPVLQAQYAQAVLAQKAEFARLALEDTRIATEATTARWASDMSSDSWLSKNIRPLTLIYILTAYLVLAFCDGAGFKVAEAYVTLLGQWGMLVMGAYFGGRTVEKVTELMQRSK